MGEPGFKVDGALVVPGDTRCIHWPETCAATQARCATAFRFCDFCLFGPPQEPVRDDSEAISPAEAVQRVIATESKVAQKLREAVIAEVNK